MVQQEVLLDGTRMLNYTVLSFLFTLEFSVDFLVAFYGHIQHHPAPIPVSQNNCHIILYHFFFGEHI